MNEQHIRNARLFNQWKKERLIDRSGYMDYNSKAVEIFRYFLKHNPKARLTIWLRNFNHLRCEYTQGRFNGSVALEIPGVKGFFTDVAQIYLNHPDLEEIFDEQLWVTLLTSADKETKLTSFGFYSLGQTISWMMGRRTTLIHQWGSGDPEYATFDSYNFFPWRSKKKLERTKPYRGYKDIWGIFSERDLKNLFGL